MRSVCVHGRCCVPRLHSRPPPPPRAVLRLCDVCQRRRRRGRAGVCAAAGHLGGGAHAAHQLGAGQRAGGGGGGAACRPKPGRLAAPTRIIASPVGLAPFLTPHTRRPLLPAVPQKAGDAQGGEGAQAEHPRVTEARLQAQQLAASVDAQQLAALAMQRPPERQLVSYEDL